MTINYRQQAKLDLAKTFENNISKIVLDVLSGNAQMRVDEMSVTIVPSFYRLRLLWRRWWPLARKREKLALITAIMAGQFADERIGNIARGRLAKHGVLGITADRYQRFGGTYVRDITPMQYRTPRAVGESAFISVPTGPNRVAVLDDGRTYAYRVD